MLSVYFILPLSSCHGWCFFYHVSNFIILYDYLKTFLVKQEEGKCRKAYKSLMIYVYDCFCDKNRSFSTWKENIDGGKGRKRGEKIIKMCYVHIQTPHEEYNHYALQICTTKKELW